LIARGCISAITSRSAVKSAGALLAISFSAAPPSIVPMVWLVSMTKAIKKQLKDSGVGTKAQKALKFQQEHGKQARKVRPSEQREAEQATQVVSEAGKA